MTIIRRDANELRYNAIHLLSKTGNPAYYTQLFRSARMFFIGMGRPDLVEDLEFMIREKLEKIMGVEINQFLLVYKNLPYLNSFTRSRNPIYSGINIYKFTMEKWLDEIEAWIFMNVIELEQDIRFTTPSRQYVF
jgi:hypothetical protein